MANSHIASGRTIPGGTAWKPYAGGDNGIYVDVNTAPGNFSSTPVYITSIGGNSNHWATTGASSVYMATPTGFRIYVRYDNGGPLTPAIANGFQWHINWIGMEV
jgi:hypothetical protein